MFLVIFSQHFINVPTFFSNIFLEASSNIFWRLLPTFLRNVPTFLEMLIHQLFFVNILNVAIFF
jgi:hypothetical protein